MARHSARAAGRPVSQHALAVELLGPAAGAFDPVKRSMVRVAVGRLRSALRELYSEELSEVPQVLVVPRRSYVLRVVPRTAWPELMGGDIRGRQRGGADGMEQRIRDAIGRRDSRDFSDAMEHLQAVAQAESDDRSIVLLVLARLAGVHLGLVDREHLERACSEALVLLGNRQPSSHHDGTSPQRVGSPYNAPL